jgi:hypothetical protein
MGQKPCLKRSTTVHTFVYIMTENVSHLNSRSTRRLCNVTQTLLHGDIGLPGNNPFSCPHSRRGINLQLLTLSAGSFIWMTLAWAQN